VILALRKRSLRAPAILFVCSETREEALKTLRSLNVEDEIGESIQALVRPSTDIFCFVRESMLNPQPWSIQLWLSRRLRWWLRLAGFQLRLTQSISNVAWSLHFAKWRHGRTI
jgi:hypothetical protein